MRTFMTDARLKVSSQAHQFLEAVFIKFETLEGVFPKSSVTHTAWKPSGPLSAMYIPV